MWNFSISLFFAMIQLKLSQFLKSPVSDIVAYVKTKKKVEQSLTKKKKKKQNLGSIKDDDLNTETNLQIQNATAEFSQKSDVVFVVVAVVEEVEGTEVTQKEDFIKIAEETTTDLQGEG